MRSDAEALTSNGTGMPGPFFAFAMESASSGPAANDAAGRKRPMLITASLLTAFTAEGPRGAGSVLVLLSFCLRQPRASRESGTAARMFRPDPVVGGQAGPKFTPRGLDAWLEATRKPRPPRGGAGSDGRLRASGRPGSKDHSGAPLKASSQG